MAIIDYAATCESIEARANVHAWPNVRRLGRNRVSAASFPSQVNVQFLIAARISKEEAKQGPQVLELLIEVVDVTREMEVVQATTLAEPIEDLSSMTSGPVGFPLLLTPMVSLTLPRSAPYLVRVKGWHGHYDFLLSVHSAD